MLPDLEKYNNEITLIMNSGIQFIDFGLKINWTEQEWRNYTTGAFKKYTNSSLCKLHMDEESGQYFDPSKPYANNKQLFVDPDIEIDVKDSLTLYNGVWIPLPIFRHINSNYDNGPYNWARVRIVELEDGADIEGNTHRITVAIDTRVYNHMQETNYLAPIIEDIHNGSNFLLAADTHQIAWYLDLQWMNEWLIYLFTNLGQEVDRLKLDKREIDEGINDRLYEAHYLNILALLVEKVKIPQIKLISNIYTDLNNVGNSVKPIPVDMVLDVGNSRTCGILIEDHKQDNGDGLKKRYQLEIRDLNSPENVYAEPFESRVEFAQAYFGNEDFSNNSGRQDAFQWPTLVRVGREALRLAGKREGNEGATGLSSPKRYLWDDNKYEQCWRFNSTYVKSEYEPYATVTPFCNLINDAGQALYTLPDEDKMPAFDSKYSRSSLMTFMLSEILMHALTQINSIAQRTKLTHARTPRYLRSVILTIPPAMPKPERDIFKSAMYQAIALIWKCLELHDYDEPVDFSNKEAREKIWPHFPEVIIQWDEATCAQVVYLYNETQHNYNGRAEEFQAAVRRADRKDDTRDVRIASIDIGGGTTDLVINDYSFESTHGGNSSNLSIVPKQKFRDGFKVAGDDILLDIVKSVIIASLVDGLNKRGLKDTNPILDQLLGGQTQKIQDEVLKQQLTLQVFAPIGLSILKAYEAYDTLTTDQQFVGKAFRDLLDPTVTVSDKALNYIDSKLQRALADDNFSILDLPILINLRKIHDSFLKGSFDICKTLNSLSELVSLYQCDILLVTGRPSKLPGIQAFLKSRLPVPVGRILSLHHYRTGSWYPFHKEGRIDDPKTTAAVGAMLCFLSKELRIANFYFSAGQIQAYSTIKYVGLLDNNNMMKNNNIFYENIDLDNVDYQLSDMTFEVRGMMRIGFKQIAIERWQASPLYLFTIETRELANKINNEGVFLNVSLRLDKKDKHKFIINKIQTSDGKNINVNKDVKLSLNTMLDAGLGETQYWLDSGTIKR